MFMGFVPVPPGSDQWHMSGVARDDLSYLGYTVDRNDNSGGD